MRLKVGTKEFNVAVAKTPEETKLGLSQTQGLRKGTGLVMLFTNNDIIPITMEDMSYSLDIIFSNKGKVVKVITGNPGDINITVSKPTDLIAEVNAGEAEGIKRGDEILLIGEKNDDGTVEMAEGGVATKGYRHVLDENGKNQMNLKGGERIFSRKSTNRMYELAKAKEYRKLGRYVIGEINKQDKRPAEYAKN